VAHILIEDGNPDLMAELEQELAEGTDFSELARQYSDDPGSSGQGGDLGFSEPGIFPQPFEDALNDLAVGEVSGPVQTDSGTHFIKLLDERRSTSEQPSFDDQRNEIARQIKRIQAEERFIDLMGRLGEVSY